MRTPLPSSSVVRRLTAIVALFVAIVALLLVLAHLQTRVHLVAVLLAGCGAEIRTAASAAEAVAVAARWPLDVLVSDIGMPGEDGYALLASLRAANGAAIPAVALTAYARPEDREHATAAGFGAHLTKPFDTEKLIAVVGRLAGR